MPAISSVTTRLPRIGSGTSSFTIRCDSPSTIAVLPTPGSPIRHGLFFVRRLKIWMIRSISFPSDRHVACAQKQARSDPGCTDPGSAYCRISPPRHPPSPAGSAHGNGPPEVPRHLQYQCTASANSHRVCVKVWSPHTPHHAGSRTGYAPSLSPCVQKYSSSASRRIPCARGDQPSGESTI